MPLAGPLVPVRLADVLREDGGVLAVGQAMLGDDLGVSRAEVDAGLGGCVSAHEVLSAGAAELFSLADWGGGSRRLLAVASGLAGFRGGGLLFHGAAGGVRGARAALTAVSRSSMACSTVASRFRTAWV